MNSLPPLPKLHAWHLPWTATSMPHALLDILRGCNLKCRACYNRLESRHKTLQEIEAEVEALLRHRRLQSISIVGGEPLMHPELCEIVKLLKRRGLRVELFTNALLLDAPACASLKTAGVDLVFLHIDSGQQRPDLPGTATAADRHRLIQEKAALLNACGLEAGLSMTAYPGQLQEVMGLVRLTLNSPNLGYLLATRFREHTGIQAVYGSLDAGLTATVTQSALPPPDPMARSHQDIQLMLHRQFALHPFARLGSNRDPHDARWLSYLVGVIHNASGGSMARSFKAGGFERLFLALSRRLSGRYPFFMPANAARFRLQLLLNAATGGHILGNLRLLAASFRPGSRLQAKRLLFQNPAEADADGNITHCINCPDAVLHNGELVPVCLADWCC